MLGWSPRAAGPRILVTLAALCAIAGCVSASQPQTVVQPRLDSAQASRAGIDPNLVRDVYYGIGFYYFEEPDIGALTVEGLNALTEADAQLRVQRGDAGITLIRAGLPVQSFPAPPNDDFAGWAAVATNALVAARTTSPNIAALDPEDVYELVFDAIAEELDPYSRYLSAQEARSERAGRGGYGGVGLLLGPGEEGGIFIREVFPGGPAERAGLEAGDRVLAVDGHSVEGRTVIDFADEVRGPAGTRLSLTIQRPDGEERTLVLTRANVIQTTVSSAFRDGVGVIDINRFNSDADDRVAAAVAAFQREHGAGLRGLVLDLRGNPGGILQTSVGVADLFISSGEIIHTRGRHPRSWQRFDAHRADDIAPGLPIAVLIDGNSASAAEIVAAALQDSGRAIVVGASSFGKGSVQTVGELPNAGEFHVTWSRFFSPSGYTIHEQGVLPTICTSGRETSADALIARFRSGSLPIPSGLEELRRRAAEDQAALARVRQACPWVTHDPELDMEVAIRLLNDPLLYRAAVAAATQGAVAMR